MVPSPRTIPRRWLTLIVAGVAFAVSVVVASLVPVPYVILSPGPTLNTLGKGPDGKPLITIADHRVYPTDGHLNLVTVSFQGGPGDGFNIFTALQAWLTPHEAVVPESELFGPGQTQQQVTQENTQAMATSQETATAAALCQLGMKFTTVDTVATVGKGMPAAGVLKSGDIITAVDGTPVGCKKDAGVLIRSHPAGSTLVLTVVRQKHARQVSLKTITEEGRPVVGVSVNETYRNFPVNVKISVGDIGGPSAGLMFALGIVDKLSPQRLTDGRFIAGTGEISVDGTVSPIGGIQQKMAGARAAGATVFLAPAQNCPDTRGAVPAGMRVIKVSTLGGAVRDLQALAAGKSVPSC